MLFLYILLVLHSVFCHDNHNRKVFYSEDDSQFHFENFLKTYNKIYDSESEKAARFNTFKENLLKINEMNRQDPHARFAINEFTDLSSEEYLMKYTGLRHDLKETDGTEACRAIYDNHFKPQTLPKAFDWRDYTTMKVGTQKACGSCWAFAVTGNVEAQYSLAYNKSVSLSEQQLVDCCYSNCGCCGGVPSRGLRYLVQVGGQESLEVYPYYGNKSICQFKPDMIQVKVFDCLTFRLTNETMIQQALVRYGPLVIAVDSISMKDYDSGVLTNCSFQGLHHAVLLVGYGTDNGTDFWIIKNSWGPMWGENGYVRIERNVNACGILNQFITTSIINTANS